MNKKGFTLVEVLAVIGILAIIVVIAVPSIITSRNTTLAKEEQTKIKEIETAASFYAKDEGKQSCYITVQNLITKGYLVGNANAKVVNPKDNTIMNSKKVYIASDKSAKYNSSANCSGCAACQ